MLYYRLKDSNAILFDRTYFWHCRGAEHATFEEALEELPLLKQQFQCGGLGITELAARNGLT
jgi:hypothetical protein